MKLRSPVRFLIAAMFPMAALAPGGSATAQQATIRGVVQERGDGTPVAEASVRVRGGPQAVADAAGRFVLQRLGPGTYTLEIDALGYVSRRIEIVIRGDTTLVIRLDADPVPIDQIEARAVTIRGTLHDAATGDRLLSGEVRIEPGGETVSANRGGFRVRGVQAGRVRVVVHALEYLPAVIEFDAERDTTLRFDMHVDSVGLRLLLRQVDRLAQRADAEPYSVRALNRDDIRRTGAPTVGDLVSRELPSWGAAPPMILSRQRRARESRSASQPPAPREPACVTYDDMPVEQAVLSGIPSELIERVEIYGYGGRMIRVYSKRYVANLMRRERLPRIIFLTTGLSVVCM
ncbi:MAG TPA: carboxypeptidase regulatory-like domain-containing protein [Longimicrobiales bacterium]